LEEVHGRSRYMWRFKTALGWGYMRSISGCNRSTRSSVRGTTRRGINCARGGTKWTNSKSKGEWSVVYLKYMDDVRFLRVGKEKKNERLELVHTDVWGPTQISSLGGSHYYVTFIDDATRKTWVYCIRQKSDVFDTFEKWKALVENETGKSLKCLR
jgi:hypothetical protein